MYKISDIDSIDTDQFNITARQLNDVEVILITPSKLKHKWSDDQLHLRSLLLSKDGTIISSGFPKFFNYGERPELDKQTDKYIIAKEVFFPIKMDGSLIVRDIIADASGEKRVNFRTRGSHDLGEFHNKVMTLITERYPLLLQPTFEGLSILFEYTSPDNRIIINYTEDTLTLLGAMQHTFDSFPRPVWLNKKDNEAFAEVLGVSPLKFYELSSNPTELLEEVKTWGDAEGVVCWCGDGDGEGEPTLLSKIKAEHYIKLHSLKFFFTGLKLRKICYAAKIENEDMLQSALYKMGVDWEVASALKPEFDEYMQSILQRRRYIESFIESFRSSGILNLETRKDIALASKQFCEKEPNMFSVCMSVALNDSSRLSKVIDAYILGIAVSSLDSFSADGKRMLQKTLIELDEENS